MHDVQLTSRAARELQNLPTSVRARVARKIAALAHNPRPSGCKKLKGSERLYRIRSGDYRVLYEVEDAATDETDGVVLVKVVRHRKDAY